MTGSGRDRSARIAYPESATGELEQRQISDWRPDPGYPGCIDAFCQNRGARRTFKVARIAEAVDLETGELVRNLPAYFGLAASDDTSIEALAAEILPAVRLLRLYCRKTRGLAKRERQKIARFVMAWSRIDDSRLDEIDTWIVNELRDYGAENQLASCDRLSHDVRSACRATALDIAAGSRRKPSDPAFLALADRLFPPA